MKKKIKIDEYDSIIKYQSDDSDKLVLEFTDKLLVEDIDKKINVKGKGQLNKQISSFIYEYLEGFHVPTFYIKNLNEHELLVKNSVLYPMEIVIYNVAFDEFSKRFQLEDMDQLNLPVTEYFLIKNDQRIMINMSHALAFCDIEPEDFRTIDRLSSKTNAVLKSLFMRRNLNLMRFALRFGKFNDQVIISNELSLDNITFFNPDLEKVFKPKWNEKNSDEAQSYFEDLTNMILKTR